MSRSGFAALVLLYFYLVMFPELGWAKKPKFIETPIQSCVVSFFTVTEASKKNLRDADNIQIPPKLDLISINRTEAFNSFNSAVGILRAHWTPEIVAKIKRIASLGKMGKLPDAERVEFNKILKESRAALKNLRFLFEALDAEHQIPEALDELTVAIGKLRDVIQGKRGDPKDLEKFSERVLNAIESKHIKKIEREIAGFQPSTRKKFDLWIWEILQDTKKILSTKNGSPDDFHQVRKNLQAIEAVYRSFLTAHPELEKELGPVVQFLIQQMERLGTAHESWERRAATSAFDYDKNKVQLPKALKIDLLDFISRVQRP